MHAFLQHDHCGDRFSPLLIGHAHDCDILNGGMAEQDIFDLPGRHIFATTHDHVIRCAPPLMITRKELDWALERLEKALLMDSVPAGVSA